MREYERLTNQKWSKDIDLTQELGYSYIYKRLNELEDKIEAGTLIEIPGIRKLNIAGMDCVEAIYIQHNGTIGECVCLNEAEAEKKLEEIINATKSIDNSEK